MPFDSTRESLREMGEIEVMHDLSRSHPLLISLLLLFVLMCI